MTLRSTVLFALPVLFALAPAAHAVVLVGTTTGSPGTYGIGSQARLQNTGGVITATFDNQAIAQGFTLSSAVVASDLSLYIYYLNTPATFTLRITDRIGSGTTAANVRATATGTFGSTAGLASVSLGNLALAAGSYYLVLSSDTLAPTPALNGSNCAGGVPPLGGINVCSNAGVWGYSPTPTNLSTAGSLSGNYVAHNFTSNTAGPAPGLTAFSPSTPIGTAMVFQLNGTVTPVPEPATWALLAAGVAGILGFRRARPRA